MDPGSSPRMRGAPVVCADLDQDAGIIPADAGSTLGLAVPSYSLEDHPRGCGEHLCAMVMEPLVGGSSPRMRGALPCQGLPGVDQRIIPADAGSTGHGA